MASVIGVLAPWVFFRSRLPRGIARFELAFVTFLYNCGGILRCWSELWDGCYILFLDIGGRRFGCATEKLRDREMDIDRLRISFERDVSRMCLPNSPAFTLEWATCIGIELAHGC